MNRPFTFYLDWVACAQFAGLFWARDNGLYEAVGLDVQLEPWSDDCGSVFEKVARLTFDGHLSAGCIEDNLLVADAADGNTLVAFGAMLQGPPMVLMSPAARPIQILEDLRGKRIGMHTDGARALEIVLALAGIPAEDVEVEVVGFDLDHLREGRFDALQGYVMTEPVQLIDSGFDVCVLPIQHPRFLPYAQVYFAERQLLEYHRTMYKDFLSASSAGWLAVSANPDAAAELLAAAMGDSTLAGQQRRMIERVIPLVLADRPVSDVGTIDADQWNRNLETYFEFGLTAQRLELSDVVFRL